MTEIKTMIYYSMENKGLIVTHFAIKEDKKPIVLVNKDEPNYQFISRYIGIGNIVDLQHLLRDDYGFSANHIDIKTIIGSTIVK